MGLITNLLYKWASTPSKPLKSNSRTLLEYEGKYWDGKKFVKDRNKAHRFKDFAAAYDFADNHFDEDHYDPEGFAVEEL